MCGAEQIKLGTSDLTHISVHPNPFYLHIVLNSCTVGTWIGIQRAAPLKRSSVLWTAPDFTYPPVNSLYIYHFSAGHWGWEVALRPIHFIKESSLWYNKDLFLS